MYNERCPNEGDTGSFREAGITVHDRRYQQKAVTVIGKIQSERWSG